MQFAIELIPDYVDLQVTTALIAISFDKNVFPYKYALMK